MDPQLADYVRRRRESGFTDDQTKQELLNGGWPENMIDEALGIQTNISTNTALPRKSGKKWLVVGCIAVILIVIILAFSGCFTKGKIPLNPQDKKTSVPATYRPGIPLDNFKFTSINVLLSDEQVKDVTPQNADSFFMNLNVESLRQDWSLYSNYYFSGEHEKRFGFSNYDPNLLYIFATPAQKESLLKATKNPALGSKREPHPDLGYITYVNMDKKTEIECVALNGCEKKDGYSLILGFTEYKYDIEEKTTFKKSAFRKELRCFKNSDGYDKYDYLEFICVDDNGFNAISSRIEFDKTTSKAKGMYSYVALIYDIRPLDAEEKYFVTTPSKLPAENQYDPLDVEFATNRIISETGALKENVNITSAAPITP